MHSDVVFLSANQNRNSLNLRIQLHCEVTKIGIQFSCLFVCLFVWFLTSSSTTRLYRGRAPRQSARQFYVLPHMRQSWKTMTFVSAGPIILTPTQPVGSGRPQQESNPGPPHQKSRALSTELPRPPFSTLSYDFVVHNNLGIDL